jgi:hypothetical protein
MSIRVASDHLIILLMDDPEAVLFRASIGAFPGRKFRQAQTVGELRRHLRAAPDPARIVSFCSRVIVPPDVIGRYSGQCFNFHPVPPGTTRVELDVLTFAELAKLARAVAPTLGNLHHDFRVSAERWGTPRP